MVYVKAYHVIMLCSHKTTLSCIIEYVTSKGIGYVGALISTHLDDGRSL